MTTARQCFIPLILVCLLIIPCPTLAQWTQGAPLSTAVGEQSSMTSVSDGAGGAIVAWSDNRFGNLDVYAQHINSNGVADWAANGVAICTAPFTQRYIRIVSDGYGGAIVAWEDLRGGTPGDIYAQRINYLGAPQWSLNGVPLCTAAGNQLYPQLVADGVGGAIAVWFDFRGLLQLYAQRIAYTGTVMWAADGVAVTAAPAQPSYLWNLDESLSVATDGSAGAVVVFEDQRAGIGNLDIYAQRISSTGAPLWAASGVAVVVAPSLEGQPSVVADITGGTMIAWKDNRLSAGYDIYAQRLTASGSPMWAANGVVVCNFAGDQIRPRLAPDNAAGAVICWHDIRGDSDIYAQKVTTSGATQWAANGIPVCNIAGGQSLPAISGDLSGATTIAWLDGRGANFDIYAQILSPNGTPQLAANGVAVCSAPNNQFNPTIVPSFVGTAIVAWEDERSDEGDAYAKKVGGAAWTYPAPVIVGAKDVPGDQGGHVYLAWNRSSLDALPDRQVQTYTVWRAISPTVAMTALTNGASVFKSGAGPAMTGPTTIRVEQASAAVHYWELITTINALAQPGYSDVVPTLFDSTAVSGGYHYFQVLAHYGGSFWASSPDSARSVDNIAPLAPLNFTAQRVAVAAAVGVSASSAALTQGDVVMHWNRSRAPDLRDYSIFRSTSNNVQPTPAFFLASTEDTVYTDSTAPLGQSFFYILTANDTHFNASAATAVVAVGPSTGAGNLPPVSILTLRQNHPNPFTGSTEFEYGLPAVSPVTISVFDVGGRLIRRIDLAEAPAGWAHFAFDGKDQRGRALASGVYFFKVSAAGHTITRKMVVAH